MHSFEPYAVFPCCFGRGLRSCVVRTVLSRGKAIVVPQLCKLLSFLKSANPNSARGSLGVQPEQFVAAHPGEQPRIAL